ncbi:Na(+)/H(+) antiporter NhaD [Morella rubra]|uniref:Na(+)/H(+) antiporter NhaD n=1 Tax=Morella rubra TaxID=262757 RepID=A0A6A1V6G5_9ROSI|nr:Na(+)/H(+) antiporter NhaD [Morella rubra]
MASLSVALCPTHHFKECSLFSSSLPTHLLQTQLSIPCLGSSFNRIRGSRFLRNEVLARAEDKARGPSSSSSSSAQKQQAQPNSEEQLEESGLMGCKYSILNAFRFVVITNVKLPTLLLVVPLRNIDPLACHRQLSPKSGSCDPLCSLDETSSRDFEATYQPKTDLVKALAIFAAAAVGAIGINQSWVAANQDVAMALLFGIGYAGIIFEESLAFNKSGVGLLMAVSLWVVRSIGAPSTDIAVSELSHASEEVSEIVFFLLGAMTIVEIVDAHQGFKLVTDNITTRKPQTLLWVVGFVTFFLSSVLDNLTSTIVMVSLLRKLVPPSEFRKFIDRLLGAVVVIAANAGVHGLLSVMLPHAVDTWSDIHFADSKGLLTSS